MCPDGGSVPSVELSTVRKGEGGCDRIYIRDIDVLMVVVVVKVVTFVVVLHLSDQSAFFL